MVAKRFPPALSRGRKVPPGLAKIKDMTQNGVTQSRPPTKSVTPMPKNTPPAPTKLVPGGNGLVQTRGTKKEFTAAHPVLASKTGAARDKFLSNHPKINANVKEFETNDSIKRQALLRRIKRVK